MASIANPHTLQFHYIVFDRAIPVATPTWELLQQYHQAARNQDTRVRMFCLVSTLLTRFPPVRRSLPWLHPVSIFSS